MSEVHDTQNPCQGTFGDLGRFEDPEFFRRNIVVKAVLRCSKRFWSLLILVFFVFVWSWSWIAKYRSGAWQDSSSAKPVSRAHLRPWGLRLALGSLGDGYGLEMALSASWQDGQRRLLSIERLVKPLADGQHGATQRWNGQRTSKLPCWPVNVPAEAPHGDRWEALPPMPDRRAVARCLGIGVSGWTLAELAGVPEFPFQNLGKPIYNWRFIAGISSSKWTFE